MSALPANVDPGNTITYTIGGSNVGTQVAHGVTVASVSLTGVLVYDALPTDPTTGLPLALSGSPSGSPAGGTVLYLPAASTMTGSPATWAWRTSAGVGDIAVAYITNGNLAVGQFYSFAYDLVVPSTMHAGLINDSGAAAYVDNNPGTPDPTIVLTNNTQINVNVLAGVLVGPVGQPGAGTAPNYNDDVQSVPLAHANTTVSFTNTVRNNGNAVDELNITLDAGSTMPAGWSVLFFRSDGVTPLIDSGSDGIPDVGPLNPGATRDFIVRVIIPGGALAGGPYNAVVRATSANNPARFNLTTDRITQVLPAAVDIGNYDGVPGTNNNPVNHNANPGTGVDFALDVINTGGSSDNYSLTSTVPGGWTVTFYNDVNGNP